ncbi:hypothetical protein ETD83_26605 [Actinomadura soli]|uniref:Sulfotransferase family protein n=1 Tax=Actinomadura soli TaxID=2508997 RepID=A0A5C4J8J3_9ACTN|nr:hypothetical protein [Actinomadura soli]TMQ92804.1 hypothetical protein ETD83_26605 [Actinomadura soli]
MASKVVLHIGVQKSGTTFLQHMVHANHQALVEAGVHYPIPRDWSRGKRTVPNHEWSTYGLLGTEYPWVSEKRAARESTSWKDLLAQANTCPGTVLLSAEALSVIRTPAVRRLLTCLDTDDVEVVITTRSLDRALPSLWQQHIRNGHSISFNDYLKNLAHHREKNLEDDPSAHIWRAFTLNKLVQRWSRSGATKVSVVTTPGNPPDLLWERFTQAIGTPALAQVPLAKEAHTGLTAPETLILASLNATLHSSRREADRIRQTITERFQTRDHRGGKVAIPPEWRLRLTEWMHEDLAALQQTPARVIGDINDLHPSTTQTRPPTPEETAQAGAEAALALAHLTPHQSPLRRTARRLRRLLP